MCLWVDNNHNSKIYVNESKNWECRTKKARKHSNASTFILCSQAIVYIRSRTPWKNVCISVYVVLLHSHGDCSAAAAAASSSLHHTAHISLLRWNMLFALFGFSRSQQTFFLFNFDIIKAHHFCPFVIKINMNIFVLGSINLFSLDRHENHHTNNLNIIIFRARNERT